MRPPTEEETYRRSRRTTARPKQGGGGGGENKTYLQNVLPAVVLYPFVRSVSRSVFPSVGRSVGISVDRSVRRSVFRLVGRSFGQAFDRLVVRSLEILALEILDPSGTYIRGEGREEVSVAPIARSFERSGIECQVWYV